jgi:hypothetical protein
MTDDTPALDPTPSSPGGRWRIPALVAALVLVIVVVVAVATRGGDDEADPAADPTTSSTAPSSASDSPTATGSASASDSPTTSDDPVPSPIIDKAVKDAIDDDFPAMVPAGVPDGWTVEKATYSPKRGGLWRITLTEPNGTEVLLAQSTKSVEGIVHEYLGADAQPAGKVNLSGTGTWAVYTSMSKTGIAKEISGTAALVVGADQDTVVTLGEQLLTAEDAGTPEAG